MGAVERAAGVHGHILGLRLVPRHPLRRDQPGRPAGGRGHGAHALQGGHSLRSAVLHRRPSNHRLQHSLGSPVPLPEPRPHRRPAAGPGRIAGGGQVSVRGSPEPRRKQAQDVSTARGQNSPGLHVPDFAEI